MTYIAKPLRSNMPPWPCCPLSCARQWAKLPQGGQTLEGSLRAGWSKVRLAAQTCGQESKQPQPSYCCAVIIIIIIIISSSIAHQPQAQTTSHRCNGRCLDRAGLEHTPPKRGGGRPKGQKAKASQPQRARSSSSVCFCCWLFASWASLVLCIAAAPLLAFLSAATCASFIFGSLFKVSSERHSYHAPGR